MFHSVGCVVLLVVLLISPGLAYADYCYWSGGGDRHHWEDTDNWKNRKMPRHDDHVVIDDGASYGIVISLDVPSLGYLERLELGGENSKYISQEDDSEVAIKNMNINRGTYSLKGDVLDIERMYTYNPGANYFDQQGGHATINELQLAYADNSHGSYRMSSGYLNVTDVFAIANSAGSDGRATFIQTGGTVISDTTLRMGKSVGAAGRAYYSLHGGSLTLNSDMPFQFTQYDGIGVGSVDVYLDFDGGLLNLLGDWDFSRLASIPDSDFRVFGKSGNPPMAPATVDNLRFVPITIDNQLYTQISAIPEPSTFILLSIGAVGLLAYAWQKRRSRSP